VARALERACGLKVGLKWPNDLQIESRKVGGILIESVTSGSRVNFVVLGIGLNLNSKKEDIRVKEATSLYEETGHQIDVESLIDDLLLELDSFYRDFVAGKVPDDEYVIRSTVLKRHIEAMVGKERFVGKALYINDDGALVLKSDEGLILRLAWVNDTSIRVLEGDAEFEESRS
jgi:BirA family biotin operon repressor/biotin-[acetyl-CoA-carboxylase] ligase